MSHGLGLNQVKVAACICLQSVSYSLVHLRVVSADRRTTLSNEVRLPRSLTRRYDMSLHDSVT